MNALKKGLWASQRMMGLVFLVAGLTKVWDPELFFWQSMPHIQQLFAEMESWERIATWALLLGPLECAVGLALLVDWKPRLGLPVGVVLMAFFVFIAALAWFRGAAENCGCFGTLIERSPGEALIEDIVMLGLLLFSWWGLRRRKVVQRAWHRRVVLIGGAVSLIVLGFRYLPERDHLTESDLRVGLELPALALSTADVDLAEGAYLVVLFSPDCVHCQHAVPDINTWIADPDVPQLIALSWFPENSPMIRWFKKHFQPRFAIASISVVDFWRLTWKYGFPRLAYIEDGVIKQVWDSGAFPPLATLKQL